MLRRLIGIYDRLASAVVQGADAQAITRLLGELVERPVILFDASLTTITTVGVADDQAGPLLDDPSAKQVLASVDAERRPIRLPALPGWSSLPSVFAPVLAGEEVLAYLMILEDPAREDRSELELLALQQAATVCALAIIRERSVSETANRLLDDLLAGLLLTQGADPLDTRRRAALLHYDTRRTYRALTAVPATALAGDGAPSALALRRRVLEALAEQLRAASPEAIVVARAAELIALLPEPEAGTAGRAALAAANHAFERVGRLYPNVALTGGVGGACTDAIHVADSYAQARRAREAAMRFGWSGKAVAVEDLGIYRLLLQVPDVKELHDFAQRVLGPLMEYDRKHQAELIRPLRAHLEHNGSLQGAARDLNVHVNTVGYRLQRIQEIARLDVGNADDRLAAQVALKIVEGI